jgi:hypothetical protein
MLKRKPKSELSSELKIYSSQPNTAKNIFFSSQNVKSCLRKSKSNPGWPMLLSDLNGLYVQLIQILINLLRAELEFLDIAAYSLLQVTKKFLNYFPEYKKEYLLIKEINTLLDQVYSNEAENKFIPALRYLKAFIECNNTADMVRVDGTNYNIPEAIDRLLVKVDDYHRHVKKNRQISSSNKQKLTTQEIVNEYLNNIVYDLFDTPYKGYTQETAKRLINIVNKYRDDSNKDIEFADLFLLYKDYESYEFPSQFLTFLEELMAKYPKQDDLSELLINNIKEEIKTHYAGTATSVSV